MDIGHLGSYIELLIGGSVFPNILLNLKAKSSYSNHIIAFAVTHTSFMFADLFNDLRKNCTELEPTPSVCHGPKE